MSKKVYVGNLPWSVDDAALKTAFSSFGEVAEATVIKNKFNGRSKGFGFVTFAVDADADKAIAEMNGKEMEGRGLKVNEAQPFDPDSKPRRPSFRGGGYGGGRGFRGGDDRGRGRERSYED